MEHLEVPPMFTFVSYSVAKDINKVKESPEGYRADLVINAGRVGRAVMACFGSITQDTPPESVLGPVGFCMGPRYPDQIPLQITPSLEPDPLADIYVQDEGQSPHELLQQRRRKRKVDNTNGNGKHDATTSKKSEEPVTFSPPARLALSEYLTLSTHDRREHFPAPLVVIERDLEFSEVQVVHYMQAAVAVNH